MEYLKDKAFVGDFADRTLKNLKLVEDNKGYEVTQLINSLLGLIVFPKERKIRPQQNTVLAQTLKNNVVFPKSDIQDDELLRNLRHAISHSHILFASSNYTDKKEIESIIFVNCKYNYNKHKSQCEIEGKDNDCEKCRLKNNSAVKPDFQLTIPIKELRNCIEIIANDLI